MIEDSWVRRDGSEDPPWRASLLEHKTTTPSWSEMTKFIFICDWAILLGNPSLEINCNILA